MDKETELNIRMKQLRESTVVYEKTLAVFKERGSLAEQMIKTKSNCRLSILTYEADNYIKMIDICIDILKFLIPTLFTIGTVTRIIPQFSGTSIFVFGLFSFCLILLVIAIIIRVWKVKSYVSKFREENKKLIIELTELQKHMTKARTLELDILMKNMDILKGQHEKLVSGKQEHTLG